MSAPYAAEVEVTAAVLVRRQVAEDGQTDAISPSPLFSEVPHTSESCATGS